jgi:low affinity Fe/Cu permease
MLKKYISLFLILTIFGTTTFINAANRDNDDEAIRTEKIKTEIRKLGTGPNAKIKLKLRDKTKIEGYISNVSENDFVVNQHNGSSTTVAYPQIGTARGNNLSGGVKIAIGIGAIVAFTYLYYKFGRRRRHIY